MALDRIVGKITNHIFWHLSHWMY